MSDAGALQHACPRCGGQMEPGIMLDHAYLMYRQAEWAKGEPQRSIWFGVRSFPTLKVDTYRCKACGYLESYALERGK